MREAVGWLRDRLDEWDEQHGTDDAPLWAEVAGTLLVFGLICRGGLHVLIAVAHDLDPHLADDHGVTLQSPVLGLRGAWRADVVARLVVLGFGLAAWSLFDPLGRSVSPAWLEPLVQAVVAFNFGFLLADPLTFFGRHLADRPTDTQETH